MEKQRQEFPESFYEDEPTRRVRRYSKKDANGSGLAGVRPKVAAAAVAGAFTTVLMYILNAALGVQPPPEVAAAVTVLFAVLAGYLQSES